MLPYNKPPFMKKLLIFFVLFLSMFDITNAWLWLIAENWDVLNISKWNEIVNKLDTKIDSWSLVWWNNINLIYSWATIKIDSTWWNETPYISINSSIQIQTNTRTSITIEWTNFIPSSIVSIAWFDWTIHTTSIISESRIELDITPWSSTAIYNIVISNNWVLNTLWSWNWNWLIQVINWIWISWNDSLGRKYTDWTYASSCNNYKNPIWNYTYDWDIGNWYYLIKPNSSSAFKAYCDMTTDSWGWTRYLDIKSTSYSFSDAKSCWLWTNINNSSLECFNPNRYSMNITDKMMAKRWWTTYYYTPTTKTSSTTTNTTAGNYYCVWAKDYMTIMKSSSYPNTNTSDSQYIRLWLNYCWHSRSLWWLHSSWYMNYTTSDSFWPIPWNRESTSKATEIYIR